jgi:hypothetical protein
MNPSKKSSSLEVKRFIKSQREFVFSAWTMPEQIKQWFGPATCKVLDVQVDLRVGGTYRFHVFSEAMGEMWVRGVYREISAPSKLVFTWQWEDDDDWKNVESVVTVELLEKDGGTEVRITHEGLPSDEHAGRHEHGWTGCLDKLEIRGAILADIFGPGRFSWNELVTTDVGAATKFYTQLFGWTTTPFGAEYILFNKDGNNVCGMMKTPKPGMPAFWIAYVTVEDVDATAAKVAELGGKVMVPPFDIPTVGRIACLSDPQGASIGLFKPQK